MEKAGEMSMGKGHAIVKAQTMEWKNNTGNRKGKEKEERGR